MLPQHTLIERTRQVCQQDERLAAALMYGSFTRGEGDEFSDIEFALFFNDIDLPSIDQQAWVERIAPVLLYFQDDLGHHTAIFAGSLIRGEFHFEPASRISSITTWQGNAWFPSLTATIMVDRTGELETLLQPIIGPPPERNIPATLISLVDNFANWVLFGVNVLQRGELARALELLNISHRYLLKLVRLEEGSTEHWPTPSKSLERDISPDAYERFRTCTAPLERSALWQAYRETWRWGRELVEAQAHQHQLALPEELLEGISTRLA